MLTRLILRDFVIVDAMDLEFGLGFTVLTGETGAGKSILVDALSLVLGERADVGCVRPGSERTEIAAEFALPTSGPVDGWLKEAGLEGDAEMLLVRRTMDTGGRSRAWINGRAVTVAQLKELGDRLADIHGQHEHQSLTRRDAQRALLDAYAGATEAAAEVARCFVEWQCLKAARLEREKNAGLAAAEHEQLAWQLQELDALVFEAGAWRETLADLQRLAHGASLVEAAQVALDALTEGEDATADRLAAVQSRLRSVSGYDPRLAEIADLIDSACIQLQESGHALRNYLDRQDLDPARLAEVERRVAEVHAMARKHRVPAEEIPELIGRKRARLAELGGGEGEEDLLRREEAARAAFDARAQALSAMRRKAAQRLARQVSDSMQRLAMEGGRFEVAWTPLAEPASFGREQAEFQVAAHTGQPLGSLARVASGGELSRVSLAIQVITSEVAAVPTLVFDEVDSGIGGRVAEIVGQLLADLGGTRQVLAVTHLPQVAARAGQHWRVSKSAVGGAARSRIEVLDARARVDELARMLGGVKITDTTRRHAEELLGQR